MFALESAWWELPVRVIAIYAVLLVLMRVSGRRTVGQFTPFDLLVVMLLSEAVSQGLVGEERSVTGAVLAAVALIGVNMLVAFVTTHSRRAQTVIEGDALLIGKDGNLFAQVLKRQRVPLSDVEQALREADCELADMRRAFLEADGKISILKNRSDRH